VEFDELRDQLTGDGLRVDVQRLIPPGARQVPVAARRNRPPQQAQHQQERGR